MPSAAASAARRCPRRSRRAGPTSHPDDLELLIADLDPVADRDVLLVGVAAPLVVLAPRRRAPAVFQLAAPSGRLKFIWK